MMTRHWWWRCHMLHSLTAIADDSTLALSYRSRVITYETVCTCIFAAHRLTRKGQTCQFFARARLIWLNQDKYKGYGSGTS